MSIFSKVAIPKIKSSVFNLSEESKLSMNFGDLVPILCKEVIPNDKFTISTELLIKFAPLKAPVMHRIKAKVDYFFVPNYQLTSKFVDFINPKVNTISNPITLPYCTPHMLYSRGKVGNTMIGSLADYLGLPVTQTNWLNNQTERISLLPFMAYQHIYNSYYRDQNMEIIENQTPQSSELYLVKDPYNFDRGGSFNLVWTEDLIALFKLRQSAWKRDYFTSALPTPQAGDDVMIPVSGVIADNGSLQLKKSDGTSAGPDHNIQTLSNFEVGIDEYNELYYKDGLEVTGTSVSINDFRKLFSLQKFKELAERGGTRYPEMVRNFFGAFLPDFYFDRPKYLGGQVQPITIGEVVQTSQSTAGASGSAQGYRAGIAQSYGKTKTVSFKSPCHGFIIGILRIMPEATYQQGLERMWTRMSLYDYAFPQFANLGEQEILNKEIFANGDEFDDAVFGYTPRYAEYKEGHSHVCGEFRNNLDYWHFGRQFATRPALNKDFIMMGQMDYDPFNVTDSQTEHVYVNLYNNILARRPLPYFGTPSGL